MTNVEALKNLYTALGGNAADVADAVTNVDVLNAIAEFLGGEADATSISEAIENIVPVAPTGGGDIDALIDDSITEINSNAQTIRTNAFSQCSSLVTADFPEATEIGTTAFSECSALEAVNCAKVETTGNRAFETCSSLKVVNFPSLPNLAGGSEFINCSALTSVEFPALTTISASNTFSGCTSLKTADFPALTTISRSDIFAARYDAPACTSLDALILRAPSVVSVTGSGFLSGTPIASGTGYIYVPDDLVDSYKAATNWSTYANQIKGISELPTE